MRISALVINCAEIQRADFIEMLQGTRLAQFSFTEARTLGDGLVKVDPLKTDMIFVEWEMSMAIGLDFLQKVRQKQRRHIYIVLILAEDDLAKLEQAPDAASADYFVVRPFTAHTLEQKLAPLIAKLTAAAKPPVPQRRGL
jgi:CheY-like chemotaxis protein